MNSKYLQLKCRDEESLVTFWAVPALELNGRTFILDSNKTLQTNEWRNRLLCKSCSLVFWSKLWLISVALVILSLLFLSLNKVESILGGKNAFSCAGIRKVVFLNFEDK